MKYPGVESGLLPLFPITPSCTITLLTTLTTTIGCAVLCSAGRARPACGRGADGRL